MEPSKPENHYLEKAVEITIRLAVLIFIFGWCFEIIQPFFSPVIWGLIIAVAVYPMFHSLQLKLKGRKKLAAFLITILFLAILAIPGWLLVDSVWDGVQRLRATYEQGQLVIPPPGDRVKDWPAFTKPLVDIWELASSNLAGAVSKYQPEIKSAAGSVLSILEKTGLGILMFMVSIIVGGIFLCYAEEGGATIRNIFKRLAGDRGLHFAEISEKTIRNVMKGVLGVAVIQSLLVAIGLVIAGVPLAGLWTLLCLISAVIQIGVGPVCIIVIIYMYSSSDPLTATLLMVWLILVSLVDNFLKPILMGKGAPVPMLVIFLGALGGFMAIGFLGLFLGAVILTLGYKLFLGWVETTA